MSEVNRLKPDLNWIRARRDLLRQVKNEVRRKVGPESSDIRAYGLRYEREFHRRWHISSKAELLNSIEGADIVYGGDFHALGQAQRTHLRILRSLSGERNIVLALECFSLNAQSWIDQYLAGRIQVDELFQRVNWEKSWGFSRESYRHLLELAKRRGFAIRALNLTRKNREVSLEERERQAAKVIVNAMSRSRGALIYVIFGDLHLASDHLPAAVKSAVKRSFRHSFQTVTVHLNSERVYFQLARKGLELSTDVVRFNRSEYCILSSPPWVQWQSYLLHLEKSDDEGLENQGEAGTGDGDDFDATDHVAHLIRIAANDLGLNFNINDLAVYTSDDNRIWTLLEQKLPPRERETARMLLASGRSFFVPSGGTGYLAQTTVNHAAALAGQYIHAKLAGQTRPLWRMPIDFPALIWSETVSYFVSKIVNHKRQAESLADLRTHLALSGPNDQGREAMKLALDQALTELILLNQGRRRRLQLRPKRKASYLEAARILGGILGERLYHAHRMNKLKVSDIVMWMKLDLLKRGFEKDYQVILRTVIDATRSGSMAGGGPRPKNRIERL